MNSVHTVRKCVQPYRYVARGDSNCAVTRGYSDTCRLTILSPPFFSLPFFPRFFHFPVENRREECEGKRLIRVKVHARCSRIFSKKLVTRGDEDRHEDEVLDIYTGITKPVKMTELKRIFWLIVLAKLSLTYIATELVTGKLGLICFSFSCS